MKQFLAFVIFSTSLACGNNEKQITPPEIANASPVEAPSQSGLEKAYFSSGCFWCAEPIYESVRGVEEVVPGYSGGHTENPSYEEVIRGTTGHAETVEVTYDPEVIDFSTLIDVYFGSQDPTQENGQGPDIGSQYRSIVFYQDEKQKQVILEKKAELQEVLQEEVAAEVLPFQKFWEAEEYHQDYEEKNPLDPYIRSVSVPRIEKFRKKFPDILKKDSP